MELTAEMKIYNWLFYVTILLLHMACSNGAWLYLKAKLDPNVCELACHIFFQEMMLKSSW